MKKKQKIIITIILAVMLIATFIISYFEIKEYLGDYESFSFLMEEFQQEMEYFGVSKIIPTIISVVAPYFVNLFIAVFYLVFLWKGKHDRAVVYMLPVVFLLFYFMGNPAMWRELVSKIIIFLSGGKLRTVTGEVYDKWCGFVWYVGIPYCLSFVLPFVAMIGYALLVFVSRTGESKKVNITLAVVTTVLLLLGVGRSVITPEPCRSTFEFWFDMLARMMGASGFEPINVGCGQFRAVYATDFSFTYFSLKEVCWIQDLIGYFVPLIWILVRTLRGVKKISHNNEIQ